MNDDGRLSEREIEDVFAEFYEQLVEPGLKLKGRQQTVGGTRLRVDLLFEDAKKRNVVLELKRDSVSREDVGQLLEYAGVIPNSRVILAAPHVGSSIKTSFEHYGIQYIEFSLTEVAKLRGLLGRRIAPSSPKLSDGEKKKIVSRIVPEPLAARTLHDGNIAFKVTYNDNGWAGVCSPDAFQFNAHEKKVFWCNEQLTWEQNCQSKRFRGKKLSAEFCPCYDSVALATLSFSPGWNHGSDSPHVCKEAKVGKVALLTSRNPGEAEDERFIFAILDIARVRVLGPDVQWAGTEYYEGTKEGAIVFSDGKQPKFWDFYRNPRAPAVVAWGAGLFRYVDDRTVREILASIGDQQGYSTAEKRKAAAMLARY